MTITHRPSWPEGFPQMRFPSWVRRSSINISDPLIRWLPIILCGLYPQWLGGWALVGHRPSGKLSSCTRVWYPRVSLLTRLSLCLWSYMYSCWTLQKSRWHKGIVFWSYWYSLVLSPSWIFWGGILRRSNCSSWSAKPGSPSRPVLKRPWLTTSCPFPPSRSRILLHVCPPYTIWWGLGMGSWSELGGIILPPGFRLGPKSGFPGALIVSWYKHNNISYIILFA